MKYHIHHTMMFISTRPKNVLVSFRIENVPALNIACKVSINRVKPTPTLLSVGKNFCFGG